MDLRFKNESGYENLALGIEMASKLLHPESSMMARIRNKDDWKYGVRSGEHAYSIFLACDKVVPIRVYRPRWCLTRAIAYFDGEAINLNYYKFEKLTGKQLVGLLCHEYAHAAGFTHGNNWKTKDKVEHSVPYYISENIGRWL